MTKRAAAGSRNDGAACIHSQGAEACIASVSLEFIKYWPGKLPLGSRVANCVCPEECDPQTANASPMSGSTLGSVIDPERRPVDRLPRCTSCDISPAPRFGAAGRC